MATSYLEPTKSYDEIISNNNNNLKANLIPSGYKKYQISKCYDKEVLEEKIVLPSYKVEKLLTFG